jgi:hypothetical protein
MMIIIFNIIFVGWPFGFDDWCIRLKPSQAKSQKQKGGRGGWGCVSGNEIKFEYFWGAGKMSLGWAGLGWAGLHVHNRASNLPILLHVLQIAYKILFIALLF